MKTFDLSKMDVTQIYHLMISVIVPRPIAWVSTLNPEGKANLAPFSYFNAVSSQPATLVFSCAIKPNGQKKDTLVNIEKTKQFVVNIADENLLGPMNQTSADYPYGVDELKEVGLSWAPSTWVKPGRVKESKVQMECELYDTLTVGDGSPGSATLVIGKILAIHVDETVLELSGKYEKVGAMALNPLSRLGGQEYGVLGKVIESKRAVIPT